MITIPVSYYLQDTMIDIVFQYKYLNFPKSKYIYFRSKFF